MSNPPRGKMNPDQEAAIDMEREFLLNELDCRRIVRSLRSTRFIGSADKETILGMEGNREQTDKLLDIIKSRTPACFDAFLQALKDNNYDRAYRQLSETLNQSGASSGDDMIQPGMRHSSRNAAGANSPIDSDEFYEADGQFSEVSQLGRGAQDLEDRVEDLEEHAENLEGRVCELERIESEQIGTNMQRNQEQIDQLTRELIDTREEVKRIRAENKQLSDELEEKIKKITSLEDQIERLETKNKHLNEKLSNLNREVSQVKKERDQDRGELKKMKTTVQEDRKKLEQTQTKLEQMHKTMEQDREQSRQDKQMLFHMLQQQMGTPRPIRTANRNNSCSRTNYPDIGKMYYSTSSSDDIGPMSIKGQAMRNKKNSSRKK